jgi:predicted ATPase
MIERIAIENFKSFGDKVEIKLNKFNVLVGPNNSGKSNFLDALRFLSEIMNENIDKALNRRGSYKSVVFNGEENREIGFLINARIENSNIEYYLKIVFPANIKEEYLISDGKELIIFKNGKAQLWNIITNSFDTIYYPSSTSQPYPVITSHLRHLRKTEYLLQWKFREILEKIEVYNFDPGKLRQKVKIGKVTKLNSDGSNLSAAIHFLRNKDREAYEELESLLKSAVPEIKYLETPPT